MYKVESNGLTIKKKKPFLQKKKKKKVPLKEPQQPSEPLAPITKAVASLWI